MPYFYNLEKRINILLIHIPKTGGTSLCHYFSHKYDISLNNSSIYTPVKHNEVLAFKSLQHYSYTKIMDNKEKGIEPFKNIDLSGLQILTSVRNPYDRVVSDLFFFNMISSQTSQEHFYEILRDKYFKNCNNRNFDNHPLPQCSFLFGALEESNIKILKMENLTEEMHNLGYKDFDIRVCTSFHYKAYRDFLNKDSIKLINDMYFMDFEYFGYDRIEII
jgi:hypothetical protein